MCKGGILHKMKKLIKKLILSVFLQCAVINCYIFLIVQFQDYYLIAKAISLVLILLVQYFVYKLYKIKPMEKQAYNDIYMVINGLFIVVEAFLFSVFL